MRRPLLLGTCTALVGLTAVLTTGPAGASSPTVRGAIAQRYASLGGWNGFLGRPLTSETPTPYRPGAYNTFRGGSIYWSPRTGAWEVHGDIRKLWGSLGYENSPLGFPTTNEGRLPGGATYNAFENGLAYFWAAGTYEVHGAISGAYDRLGRENGRLGFPVSNERGTPDSFGRYNVFQRGSVYWTPETGAHNVEGRIFDKWGSIGWENSALGYPISDEYAVDGGRAADFEYGTVTWKPGTGAVVTGFLAAVSAVDGAAGAFSVADVGQDFRYDGNDEYARVVIAANGDVGEPAPLTRDEFAAQLEVDSIVAADGYSLDPAGVSSFVLVEDNTEAGMTPTQSGRVLQR